MGVYASRIEIDGIHYKGMTNIGVKPTLDASDLTIETNIFDFDQDVYGKQVVVTFEGRIRDEHKFAGLEALTAQLAQDRIKALKILKD